MKWIREHKKLCIVLAVILVIVIVLLAIRQAGIKALESLESKPETSTIEKRTLVESVSATGNFVACDSTSVSAEITNVKFLTLKVKVGDTVSAGQILATLDTEELQEQYNDACKNLTDSRNQSQRNKDSAQRSLDDAAKNKDESLKEVDTNITDAYNDWQDAKTEYQNKKKQLDDVKKQLQGLTVQNANYGSLSSQKNALENEVKTTKTTMERREREYNDRVSKREDRIKTINDNYQNQVDSYNTTMENADSAADAQQEQVDNLAEQIGNATVKAPVSGLVTAVNYEVGDNYNGADICVIQNVSAFDVMTEIDEYDINKIKVGQEVLIKTNATGDTELSGTVAEVSPIATGNNGTSGSTGDLAGLGIDIEGMMNAGGISGSGSNNDVTYTVKIGVNTPCEELRIGMTAKLSIILRKNEDVLSVPYNAVQEKEDKSLYIEEVTGEDKDGNYVTKEIPVTKGLESDYYVEVIGDKVKEGMKILIPKAEGSSILEEMLAESGATGGIK